MKYSNPLISTLLIGAGLLNLVAPVLALGTDADTNISNTATATYQDPSGATSNTTSNTVVVKVAEVAGITITAGAVTNTGGTQVTDGAPTAVTTALKGADNLVFEFDLTNTGNDTTSFFVPNQAQVGGSPVTVQKVQYFDGATQKWTDVSTLTNNIVSGDSTDGSPIKAGEIVKVRVLATVNAGTTTGAINVTLGNAGPNIQNLQNDPFAATGGDVYTVDNDGTPGDVAGAPSNGVREAVATAKTVVNPGEQAFVKVTKKADPVNDNTSIDNITDDKVTYNLELDVAGTAPTGTNLVAADLAGTSMTIDGKVAPQILVSDAIPTGTTLSTASGDAPVAPTGWTVIYSETAIGTTTATSPSVVWTATAPASLTTVTRVGYVMSGKIDKGTTVSGFKLTLNLNLPATGGSVLNIAQAFGTTLVNGAPDPTKPAVDESGDTQFNNLNPDGTTGPTPTNGIATGADGTDTANNNTGTGSGGEANIVTVAPIAATGITPIFNGPENKPTAIGPSGLPNDDFTNKSVTIDTTQAQWDPLTGKPSTVDPQSMGFTNTVAQDPAIPAVDKRPQFVALLPTTPANKTDLPDKTIVKITSAGVTVAYEYKQSDGTFTPVVANTPPIQLTVPVTGSVSYGVDIDLPDKTAQLQGYSVPVTAFSNGAPAVVNPQTGVVEKIAIILADGDINVIGANDAQNITIDRLYTGYLKMAKEAQVYKLVDGVQTIISPFSATAPKAAPGEFIEYRIKYSNISEATGATTGSVAMDAKNIVILEKGVTSGAGGNNWGTLTDHKPGTANDSNGVIKFDGGTKTNGDVVIGEYLDTVPTLAPGATGTFTFTRQVK